MTIAQQIVAEAREHGLRHFFGNPGGGVSLDIIEAGCQTGMEFVPVAHESSSAIIAGYYGLIKGTAGLAVVIRGVGAGNLVGGIVNAHFERLPVVTVCEANPISWGDWCGVQHCDQGKLFAAAAKYQADLGAATADEVLRYAFRVAAEGRPGPVVLSFPGDADKSRGSPPSLNGGPPCVAQDSGDLQSAREFLVRCVRPVVIAGADIIRARATSELRHMVEAAGAAVLVTMDARGVFPESHPRWAGVLKGMFQANVIETDILQHADGVLIAGADAMMMHSPWTPDITACELTARPDCPPLHPHPAVRVSGDLKLMLRDLAPSPRQGFEEYEVQRLRCNILQHFQRPTHARLAAQDIIGITRRLLPADGILFSETGVYINMLEHLWPVEKPGTYFGTSGGRTMGLTLPAVIGARLADPVTPIVGIGGNGSLLMPLGELETMARTRVALPLVIVNDQALGTIKWRQRARGFVDHGLDLHPIDFVSIAEACGLRGVVVHTPEEFESALGAALRCGRTTLIDARVDPAAYQDSFGPTIGVLNAQPACA